MSNSQQEIDVIKVKIPKRRRERIQRKRIEQNESNPRRNPNNRMHIKSKNKKKPLKKKDKKENSTEYKDENLN